MILDSLIVDTLNTTSSGMASESMFYVIAMALLTIYEICARLIPTTKDISVLSIVVSVLTKIIPNLKKSGGTH
jgi:hypothetical protein